MLVALYYSFFREHESARFISEIVFKASYCGVYVYIYTTVGKRVTTRADMHFPPLFIY